MKSLTELYRLGRGPSSSHTMAPARAAARFRHDFPLAASFRVTLYGSLAATGKGHMTDRAIEEALRPGTTRIVWEPGLSLPEHPNAMRFEALDAAGTTLAQRDEYSIGGGALLSDRTMAETYDAVSLEQVLADCQRTGSSFWEYVRTRETAATWIHLTEVWSAMTESIRRGLSSEGAIPGGLGLCRRARSLLRKSQMLDAAFRAEGLLAAYAYAVAEENACGGAVVTAPTCGSSGVLPAVLYHLRQTLALADEDMVRALATAGLFGNVVKANGSISGADVGCQGEIGTACSMAAAAATQLHGGTLRQIEYAAEMGLEHHFGLTCDPVDGLVQIPCIERNAHAAMRAIGCARFALLSDGTHRISFDDAVVVLLETGRNLSSLYRETAGGGLARVHRARQR
ncbi:MAG: L-serine ammonia-lyase, iron-sulfur-dependent, subunit alpha [Kiritimatiellae bacterium]|nr:L-serine ammonia-lyase, iron-sulfur-dependent, subunit alpha [Kiritimatiellia bacterium]